jgi:membrane-associated protease RseP (regulator of RpoE activity)
MPDSRLGQQEAPIVPDNDREQDSAPTPDEGWEFVEEMLSKPGFVPRDRYWLHVLLLLATLASTVFAGGQWANRSLVYAVEGTAAFIEDGLAFGLSLLLFLTVHEFGHYFAARRHRVRTSLPYYIPLPFIGIGTLGAVIRIRQPIPSMRSLFDIGVAGPVAGFVMVFVILLGSLVALPPPDYLLDLPGHEEMKDHIRDTGRFPETMPEPATVEDIETVNIVVGQTLLFWAMTSMFDDMPPMYEMYHYPALFAAWLGLFFTALNLLPVGQLDGGHILYSLVGPRWHGVLARGFVLVLLLSGGVGFLSDAAPGMYELRVWLGPYNWFVLTAIYYLYLLRIFDGNHGQIAPALLGLMIVSVLVLLSEPLVSAVGHTGWLIWCLLIVLLIKVDHPPVRRSEPLSRGRKLLGIAAMIIFVLCFSLQPFTVV